MRYLHLFFLLVLPLLPKAQSYGREWIVFGQPYLKCRVVQDGMYRITGAQLLAAGLPPASTGAQLQLYRDGEQQPIWVSSNNTLQAGDWVEFYGRRADGRAERALYRDTLQQLNPEQSLLHDTATYFLTVSASGPWMRYTPQLNDMPNAGTPESYVWMRQAVNYRNVFVSGPSAPEGQQFVPESYSLNLSQYEGEGYVKSLTTTDDSIALLLPQVYSAAGAPALDLKATVVGRSYLGNHQINLSVAGLPVDDTTYSAFQFVRLNGTVPASMAASGTLMLKFQPGGLPNDRYGVVSAACRYPALCQAGNQNSLAFELDAHPSPVTLSFLQFSFGNQLPVLYDLNHGWVMNGDTSVPGTVRFVVPASATTARFLLQSRMGAAYRNAGGLQSVSFKNYALPAQQGDFLIITDKRYTNDGQGHDYVEQYRAYRQSVAGGNWQATVAYVDDLGNEFGYGQDFSTLALRNYLRYAAQSPAWTKAPKQVFIIGRGLDYSSYLPYRAAAYSSYPFYAVPTFGQPGSDWLLCDLNLDDQPDLPVGRLSAFNPSDINNYLNKVQEHEAGLTTNVQDAANKLWRKRILHIAGATDSLQLVQIESALKRQQTILETAGMGASGVLVTKSNSPEKEAVNNALIDSMYNSGIGILQFFGHSTATTIDYGLDFPEKYHNEGRYPLMIANGCGAGNIFLFTGQRYLSERFVSMPNGGAIGFLAGLNSGFSAYLGLYTDSLYHRIGNTMPEKGIGEQLVSNIGRLVGLPNFQNDMLLKVHTEQILLNGDPSLRLFPFTQADYAVDSNSIRIAPSDLHTGLDSFNVNLRFMNLGAFVKDSVNLRLRRVLSDQTLQTVWSALIPGFAYEHTLDLLLPAWGETGRDTNRLIADIDYSTEIPELSETNNTAQRKVFIRHRGLRPLWPYEFAIIQDTALVLKAATLDPFADAQTWRMELDTNRSFTSPAFRSAVLPSSGGIIRWKPGLPFADSTVWYWRAAADDGKGEWMQSSFLFLSSVPGGWSQSHMGQFLADEFVNLELDSASRRFTYSLSSQLLQAQNTCMFGPAPFSYDWPDYLVKQNGRTLYTFGCDPWPGYSSLQVVVIDSLSGKPWLNTRPNPAVAGGKYGSFDPCRITNNGIKEDPFFEFSFLTTASRKVLMDFLDTIPAGHYVMVQPRLCVGATCGTTNTTFINQWKSDTTTYGSGKSLYHKLKGMGFTKIDSFYRNRPLIFWTRKGDMASVQQLVANSIQDKLYGEFSYQILYDRATMSSPLIGPAQTWTSFHNRQSADGPAAGDSTRFDVFGVSASGQETKLASVQGDTSLNFIDAAAWPYLRLNMQSADAVNRTPSQLKYWRVHYTGVPEVAVNASRRYNVSNSVLPDTKRIELAVENVSEWPTDSLLVRFYLYDRFNVRTVLGEQRYRSLTAGDTLHVGYNLNTNGLFANMKWEVEVNPSNDQPEQYHPNNFARRMLSLIDPNLPLPVTLRRFTVFEEDCGAKLEWTLSDADQFSHTEIWRRSATMNEQIGRVPMSVSGPSEQSFTFADPSVSPGWYAYTLKLVDLDGHFVNSPERSLVLRCGAEDEMAMLFPNPASQQTNLYLSTGSERHYRITVTNTLGQVVLLREENLNRESRLLVLPCAGWVTGVYSVSVQDDLGTQQTLRLMVQ